MSGRLVNQKTNNYKGLREISAQNVLPKKEPFFKVENQVIDNGAVFGDSYMLLIYLVLLRFANNNKTVNPSYAHLAKITNCSVRMVQNKVKKLVNMGLITIESGKASGQSNTYKIKNFSDWLEFKKENRCESSRNEINNPIRRGYAGDAYRVGTWCVGGKHVVPTKKNNRKRTIEKEEENKNKNDPNLALEAIATKVIDYLNQKTGKNFESTKETRIHILARLRSGRTFEDCKHVIDVKTDEWLNDPIRCKNLNHATLFREGNFDRYLNQEIVISKRNQSTFRRVEKVTQYPELKDLKPISIQEVESLLQGL